MPSVSQKLLNLKRQLYPTGRAFKMPKDGALEKLHSALIVSEEQAHNDAKAIYNSILPDNDNFTTDDAADWERRLGLITNTLVSLSDRKLAIKRKLNHPGVNPARGHYLWVERQLQDAGFNVYVYENRFDDYPNGYITQTPIDLTGDYSLLSELQHGMVQHGEAQHGFFYNNKVANHIDKTRDLTFDIGSNFRSTFFIGGNPVGTFATVNADRELEFRQLILQLKPVQTVALLFITYI